MSVDPFRFAEMMKDVSCQARNYSKSLVASLIKISSLEQMRLKRRN